MKTLDIAFEIIGQIIKIGESTVNPDQAYVLIKTADNRLLSLYPYKNTLEGVKVRKDYTFLFSKSTKLNEKTGQPFENLVAVL